MKKNNIIIKKKWITGGAYIGPESMEQVQTNLILNSMKAMTRGGILTQETIKGTKFIVSIPPKTKKWIIRQGK